MLDRNVVPNFSSPEQAGLELCAVLTASGGSCFVEGGVIMSSSQAFSQAGLEPIGLTTFEISTIKLGQFWTTGCTCLIASGAANVMMMMDTVAAFSCDTFGANVEAFDALHFETCRQHRGQITSANNLRLILEGSKRVNSPPVGFVSAESAFNVIPEVNGPSMDSVSSTVK